MSEETYPYQAAETSSIGISTNPASPSPNGHVALTREAIIAAPDVETEWLDIPEWGGGVYVRGLTAQQRDRIEASLVNKKGEADPNALATFRARMAVVAMVDGHGRSIFRDTPSDIAVVAKKGSKGVSRVLDLCRKLSGMTDEDMADLEKNFVSTDGDDSATG